MAASWQRLGDAAGCVGIGVNRVHIEPGRLSTPPHSHGASEEIVFVLGGSGMSWQDEQVYELRPNDCIVHLADHEEYYPPADRFRDWFGGMSNVTIEVYPGTRHAFFNDTVPTHYDADAASLSWDRTVSFLRQHLGT